MRVLRELGIVRIGDGNAWCCVVEARMRQPQRMSDLVHDRVEGIAAVVNHA